MINNRTVLTAAHCVDGLTDPSQVTIQLGCNVRDDPACPELAISEIMKHVNYVLPENGNDNDIALLRLESPIAQYTDAIRPVCIPAVGAGNPEPGSLMHIAGWGITCGRKNCVAAPELKDATVTVEPPSSICGEGEDTILCVSYNSGEACPGDSGGFLGMRLEAAGGRWTQFGLTSYGQQGPNKRCNFQSGGVNYPEGFTETTNENNANLNDWIRERW